MHPQHWPDDLDHTDKRVVVIGSGASAVTLVPALAETTRTSPCCNTYLHIVSALRRDAIASALERVLPQRRAARVVFWKHVLLSLRG